MKSARREQNQESTRKEIKSFAWHQIATKGVNLISLGAIARSMNLTTPALYRYFEKRDDLIVALTRDAYQSFYNSLIEARDNISEKNHADRFRTLCLAYHQWAIDNPPQYQIIFGAHLSPQKMNEAIGEIVDHSFAVFLNVIDQAYKAQKIHLDQRVQISNETRSRIEKMSQYEINYPAEVIHLTLITWNFLNVITALELSNHYSMILTAQSPELFQIQVNQFMKSLNFS